MKLSNLLLLLALVMSYVPAFAEEDEEDLDLDFYFSTREKSTIDDFPLQEIDSEELSNAAIAGALQSNSTGDNLDAKPIYLEEKESQDKNKVASRDKKKDSDQLEAEKLLKFSQQLSPTPPPVPEFVTPSIRTLQVNSTTVERP